MSNEIIYLHYPRSNSTDEKHCKDKKDPCVDPSLIKVQWCAMTTYNTNLASEFYVLSMLYRLGAAAALTLGNKKAVDIIVVNENGTTSTIDVKGLEKRYDWPADNIHELNKRQHFYALVSFAVPSVWIIPSDELEGFIIQYRTRKVISRARVATQGEKYRQAWSQLIR